MQPKGLYLVLMSHYLVCASSEGSRGTAQMHIFFLSILLARSIMNVMQASANLEIKNIAVFRSALNSSVVWVMATGDRL